MTAAPFDEDDPPTPDALGLDAAREVLSSIGGAIDVRLDASVTIVTAVIPGTLP